MKDEFVDKIYCDKKYISLVDELIGNSFIKYEPSLTYSLGYNEENKCIEVTIKILN